MFGIATGRHEESPLLSLVLFVLRVRQHKVGVMPVEASCFKKGVSFGVSSMAMKINRKKRLVPEKEVRQKPAQILSKVSIIWACFRIFPNRRNFNVYAITCSWGVQNYLPPHTKASLTQIGPRLRGNLPTRFHTFSYFPTSTTTSLHTRTTEKD